MAVDVAIVGAGAAGLATGIFLRRLNPGVRVVVLDGARRPGAKILVSGGSRCNVTNAIVTERDFQGGSRHVIRRVLRALPVPETVAFFEEIGVRLHEEPGGKLFPDSNRSRDVLEALLRELERTGAALHSGRRVLGVERTAEGFRLDTAGPPLHASFVVLATGGQSLPKTGSDGAGYEMARALGHAIVPTTPALVPLTLDPAAEGGIHQALSGVSHDVTLAIWIDGAVALRLDGALLWTHFGISGPVVLDASRHWLRARLEGRPVQITASFVPGGDFDAVDRRWTAIADERPRATIQTVLATLVPASVASAVLAHLELAPDRNVARLGRDDRRRLARALTAWPLPVSGSRGYNYAEATAGGVDLREVDPSTLESRRCPGLFLVGEILDVDGRIGGFNFQWAWSSGRVAGAALARRT